MPLMAETATAATRLEPLLTEAVTSDGENGGSKGRWSCVGETAGECAAVCCCCPCGMMHLVILAVYRLPAGIWRRKRRQRLLRKRRKFLSEEKESNRKVNYAPGLHTEEEEEADGGGRNDAVEWEDEIWEGFYTAGFWRSHSERDDS